MAQTQQQTGGNQQRFRPMGEQGGEDSNESNLSSSPIVNISAIAMRGFGQFYDLQAAAARMVFQSQARAASAFGLPDYSHLFQFTDERAKRAFSSTTEQLLNTAEQTKGTFQDVQREVGKLMEVQAVSVAENWQQSLQELSAQAEEHMNQLKELARQQAEQAKQATESLSEAARESFREGSQQLRETMQQGAETGREAMRQAQGTAQGMAQEGQNAARQQENATHENDEHGKRKGRG
ncbi:MAG: hypothetical protein ACM3SV_11550 [Betaproteobacteria bacterium]